MFSATEGQLRQFPWILYELFSIIIIHDFFILISVKTCRTAHHFSSTPKSCRNHSKHLLASSSCNHHHWFKLHLVLLHIKYHCQQLHLGTSLNSRLFISPTLAQDMSMIMPVSMPVSIQRHICLWQIHYKPTPNQQHQTVGNVSSSVISTPPAVSPGDISVSTPVSKSVHPNVSTSPKEEEMYVLSRNSPVTNEQVRSEITSGSCWR